MQPTNSLLMVTLEQRLALLWIKKRQPTGFGSIKDPAAPKPETMRGLIRAELVHMDPNRKPFDSPRFCLTHKGNEILGTS